MQDDVPKFVTVVLAAGDSRRMGRPKALLPLDGRTALECVVARAWDARAQGVIVCVSRELSPLLPAIDGHVVQVDDAERQRGPIASIRHALTCGPTLMHAPITAWLIWPVDHPFVDLTTIRMLIASPGDVVVPTHDGRGGHPIVISEKMRPSLLAATESEGNLRSFLAGENKTSVPVSHPAILWNCDTAASFEDFRRRCSSDEGQH